MPDTIDEMILNITTNRNTIRNKLYSFGKVAPSASLNECAIAVNNLTEASVVATLISGDDYELTVTGGIITSV